MGLTIENCVIGIYVDAGVRVVFEDLVLRNCSTGMYVSTRAEEAVLAIRRSSFTNSANAIVFKAAHAALRVEKTMIYKNGKSFHSPPPNLDDASVTGRPGMFYYRSKHWEELLKIRASFECDDTDTGCERIAGI